MFVGDSDRSSRGVGWPRVESDQLATTAAGHRPSSARDTTTGPTRSEHQILRLALPSPKTTSTGGHWRVRLGVDRRGLTEHINRLTKLEDSTTIELIRQHGVPFTVTVQARSNVRLDVTTSQTSRSPGTTAQLRATLSDFGIPLVSSASVNATVRRPDGTISTVAPTETDPATYDTDIDTPITGVYRVLVNATGTTLHGEPFTREELRTLAVWNGGDDQPPSADDHQSGTLCELLTCLVGSGAFDEAAKRVGIDLAAVERCLRHVCN